MPAFLHVRACLPACCLCVCTCAHVRARVQVHDSLHLVLEYHEKVAAATAAPPVTVTDLKSYSPDKFVVLCDEALGPRLQYPHLPGTAASQAAAEESSAAASSVPGDRGAGSKVFALAPEGSDAKENVPNGRS